MAITMTTSRCGELVGATLAEILDREYGDGAAAMKSGDPNRAEWGQVVRRVEYSSWEVLDSILYMEGEDDVVDAVEAMRDLRDVSVEILDLDSQRRELVRRRDVLVRQVSRAGVSVKEIMDATHLSRTSVAAIRNP